MKFIDLQNYLSKVLRRTVTQRQIADVLGMDRSSISLYIKKDADLKGTHIEKIEEYYGIKLGDAIINKMADDVLDMLPIRGELSASLGSGCNVFCEEVTEHFSIPKTLMKKIGASPEHSCIINTSGESMYPTIIGGQDQIMIDESKKDIYDGKIYLFRMENSLFAKRLQKLPKNRIKVISDNPEYESYIIDLNDENANFDIIGRVMWISRIL